MFPVSGAYLVPNPLLGEEKMNELAARGPMVEVHILKEPFTGADMGKCMAMGYLHMLVICMLVTGILVGLSQAFETYRRRVKFCALLGLLVGTCDLGSAIWWHHALGWTLAQSIYDFAAFTIIGLVLGKFVTPKAAATAA